MSKKKMPVAFRAILKGWWSKTVHLIDPDATTDTIFVGICGVKANAFPSEDGPGVLYINSLEEVDVDRLTICPECKAAQTPS